MLTSLRQDLGYAARVLGRQRLPTAAAVACLALGIGATTAMFSVGSTLLTQPLPFPSGERLVEIDSRNGTPQPDPPSSYQDMLDWRRLSHSFQAMGGLGEWDFIVRAGQPLLVHGGLATAGFFETLGARPEAGRLFTPDEDEPTGPRVAIVSHGLADRLPGGADSVVGRVVDVTGVPTTIVGVLPERWRFPTRAEIWVPVAHANGRAVRGSRNLMVVAAVRPGVTLEDAQRDMAAIGARLASEYPSSNATIRPVVRSLRERYIGRSRRPMLILGVSIVLMLLVACANAAGLQLARAAQRTREIAVRSALGAARGRIARQLLTESVLLSLMAALLGVGLALWGTSVVSRAVAAGAPPWLTFGLDARALAFTVAISLAVGIAFGVAPAARLASVDPASVLRGGAGWGAGKGRLQRALVVTEVASSLVLLVGAGLSGLGAYRLQHVPLGFDPSRMLVFRVLLEGPQYGASSRRVATTDELVRRLNQLPGVESAAAVGLPPILDCCSRFGIEVEGQPVEPGQAPLIAGNTVTPGYFRTMRMTLSRGRDFAPGEGSDAAPVAIVTEAFARQYWPGADAIGRRFRAGSDTAWTRVIGVASDARQSSLGDVPEPEVYFPYAQQRWSGMSYVVRARVDDALSVLAPARRAVASLDPAAPVFAEQTMSAGIAERLVAPRTLGALIAGFALIGLLLATAGVYAVMAFYVSQRTRELGIRMALGAAPVGLRALVLRQGAGLSAVGSLIGLLLSWWLSRVLGNAFYGVQAFEPLLYLAPAGLLGVVAVAASYGPALRASRVDPMDALRAD